MLFELKEYTAVQTGYVAITDGIWNTGIGLTTKQPEILDLYILSACIVAFELKICIWQVFVYEGFKILIISAVHCWVHSTHMAEPITCNSGRPDKHR